ncbi:MAG TPA: glycosyltransferase [Nitrospirota bacterium]|nr:glycosyltransferase [Nitrospirota bacterium]
MSKKILMADSRSWNAPYRVGSHHYAQQFMRAGYDLCWITHPISPLHRLSRQYKLYAEDILDKYRIWRAGGVREGNLLQYTPLTLLPYANVPVLRSNFVHRNMLRFTVPSLRRYLRKTGFDRVDILWFANPALSGLLDIVSYAKCVFRIADDNAAFQLVPDSVKRAEQQLVGKADAVFVTAQSLQERYAWAQEKLHYLPNGVDFDFFRNSEPPLPKEYETIPGPRVLYVGTIAEWFDMDLLQSAASALLDHSFILIGEPHVNLSALTRMKNVFLLGGRPYKDIPAYMNHADIGIIPFKKSKLVDAINPVKLYEYFACGLPVVATAWKTLEDIKSPALLASSAEEFVALLRRGLAERERNKQEYLAFSRTHSWERRFQDILSTLHLL